jgi:hypothetical protein
MIESLGNGQFGEVYHGLLKVKLIITSFLPTYSYFDLD